MSVDSWETLTLFVEDSHVRTFPSQASELDLPVSEQVCSGTHSLSRAISKRDGSFWRMCQDFYQATADAISESSSLRWPTQGIATSSGGFWIRSSSESPNVAVDSSLQQVLEDTVDDRYLLSEKACAGILRRAERRGRTLPDPLREALLAVAS
jgi:hypothetical protein